MITFREFIYICMRNNNIETQAELLKRINNLGHNRKYVRQHLNNTINEIDYDSTYLVALEEVFKLKSGTLLNMANNVVIRKPTNKGKVNEEFMYKKSEFYRLGNKTKLERLEELDNGKEEE